MRKPHLSLTLSGLALLVAILWLTSCAPPTVKPVAEEAAPRTVTPPPVQAASANPPQTLSPILKITPSPTVTSAPDQFATRVIFKAEDGRELVGYFYPSWKSNAPVVVLMHQYKSNQTAWNESGIIPWMQNWGALDPSGLAYNYAGGKLPQMPSDLSFAVFTFDFRGHGESLPLIRGKDFSQHAAGFLMDAKAAYAIARTMPGVDPNRVIGIGTSIGADAVVDACGEGCAGAFSVSPGNWLGVDYAEAVQAMIQDGKPVRCIYATNDPPTPETCWSLEPNELYKIFGYTGVKHGITFFVPRKMETKFGPRLLEFLQSASQ